MNLFCSQLHEAGLIANPSVSSFDKKKDWYQRPYYSLESKKKTLDTNLVGLEAP